MDLKFKLSFKIFLSTLVIYFYLCFNNEVYVPLQVSSVQLRDDLLSMLVAGHETTGSVLTWTTYLLSKVSLLLYIPMVIFHCILSLFAYICSNNIQNLKCVVYCVFLILFSQVSFQS